MGERNSALILGILFTLLGVAGFIPAFVSMPSEAAVSLATAPSRFYGKGFGYLFGLFPINLVHNLVHFAVGIAGIAMSASAKGARTYNRFFAYAYAVLAVLGMLPSAKTFFGLMPIYGNNVWFNGLTAAIAAYFGLIKPTAQSMDATAASKS
ncbi:MAG: DUF4383 domain-containing protein [Microcystaceae cyanobacterium]